MQNAMKESNYAHALNSTVHELNFNELVKLFAN